MKNMLILLLSFSMMSFTIHKEDSPILNGVYGTEIVNLTLNENQTFLYVDRSNSANQISVSGTWIYSKGKLILNTDQEIKFHNQWTVNNDSKSIKARKGLAFYRLCLTE